MRKNKTIELAGRQVQVQEFRIKDLREHYENIKGASSDDQLTIIGETAQRLIRLGTGLTIEDLQEFTLSEIKDLWDCLLEVNGAFFEISDALGLGEIVKSLWTAARMDLIRRFAASLLPATAPASGTTDIPSS
jgi:hypothetical protein